MRAASGPYKKNAGLRKKWCNEAVGAPGFRGVKMSGECAPQDGDNSKPQLYRQGLLVSPVLCPFLAHHSGGFQGPAGRVSQPAVSPAPSRVHF